MGLLRSAHVCVYVYMHVCMCVCVCVCACVSNRLICTFHDKVGTVAHDICSFETLLFLSRLPTPLWEHEWISGLTTRHQVFPSLWKEVLPLVPKSTRKMLLTVAKTSTPKKIRCGKERDVYVLAQKLWSRDFVVLLLPCDHSRERERERERRERERERERSIWPSNFNRNC